MSFTFFSTCSNASKKVFDSYYFLKSLFDLKNDRESFSAKCLPQIRVGSCFRSMTLVVNDAMVAIGKKNKIISGGNSRFKRTGLFLLSLIDLQSRFWYIFCATGPKNIYDNRYLTVA